MQVGAAPPDLGLCGYKEPRIKSEVDEDEVV